MTDTQSPKDKTPWYIPVADWVKLNGGEMIVDAIMVQVTNIIFSLTGFYGWVMKIALRYIIIPMSRHAKRHIRRSKAANEALIKRDEVYNDPTKTNADLIKADDDFFNRPK